MSEQSPEQRQDHTDARLDGLEDLGEDSPITKAIVATVKAAIHDAFRWRNVFMIVMAFALVISLAAGGFTLYRTLTHPYTNQLQRQVTSQKMYTDQQVQHECKALALLTHTPVPKPTDPSANPSRETTYEFYVALVYWEHQDHCPGT